MSKPIFASTDRIALVGTAPSSAALAPWGDPSWTLWTCSPGTMPFARRAPDCHFEIHRWLPGAPRLPMDYVTWLATTPRVVAMIEPVRELPRSVAFPKDECLAEFGPYPMTSTVAWMLALAMLQRPAAIGLWGIDMAASGEYWSQRPGCQFLMWLARERGIEIVVPPESDLLQPPPLYGFCEVDPFWIKMETRAADLSSRRAAAEAEARRQAETAAYYRGACDQVENLRNTWATDYVR